MSEYPNDQPMMPTNVCNEPVGSNVHDGIDRIDDRAEGGQRSCVFDLTGPRENTPLTLREQSGATRQREKDEDSLQPVGNDGIGEGHATILPRPRLRRAWNGFGGRARSFGRRIEASAARWKARMSEKPRRFWRLTSPARLGGRWGGAGRLVL